MNTKDVCLVAGGAGFIGSHLVDTLLGKGYRVLCIDNLITGNIQNIKQASQNSNFEFIEHDITTPLPQKVYEGAISYIFHLASPASPISFIKLAEEIALVNSLGTLQLLQLAHQNKAKLLFTSTSEVYGKALEHPQKETYWGNVNPIGVRSCYDESKRFGETLISLYQRKYHVKATTMRVFNTYGPRMTKDDGRVVATFVSQALSGLPLTIHGDGSQTRSLCFVDDMVGGLVAAMFSDTTTGDVINIGNPDEYTMLELAKKVIFLTGSKSEIIYDALPPDDPEKRRPDITKMKKLTNWEPKTQLTIGIKKTVAYNQQEQR